LFRANKGFKNKIKLIVLICHDLINSILMREEKIFISKLAKKPVFC